MDATVAPLVTMLEMHTRLLLNCLDGVDDAVAARRLSDRTNHLAFLALHLVDSRWYAVRMAGGEVRNPFATLLEGIQSIEGLREVPPLDEIRAAWRDAGEALRETIARMGPGTLNAPSPMPLPVSDPSMRGAVAFIASHEAYHIGQMSLLRKELGFPAMRYD